MFKVLRERLEERLAGLEDRLENDYQSFGDVEEVAHERGKVRAYEEVLELLTKLSPCEREECDYFKHYLALGPADLTHGGYHMAAAACERFQLKAEKWYDEHPTGNLPQFIERGCRFWEAKVRA